MNSIQFFKKEKHFELYKKDFEELLKYERIKIPCVVCGSNDCTELFIKYNMRVVRCNKCGHVYVNPQFTGDAIKKLYDLSYWQSLQPAIGNVKLTDRVEFDYQNAVAKLRRDILPFKQNGKFLDIGCSNGALVKCAKEFGFDTIGIEVSKDVVQFAHQCFPDISVREGLLTEQNFSENYFDVITLYDVLEHLFNPRIELNEIYRILKPGGLLFIETPTTDSIFYLEDPYSWDLMNPIEHVHLFNEENLIRLLIEIGYVIIESKCPHENNITVHCTKA
ncbi:Methyltransferase type 11 [Thermoanaerobacterium thermosaccharolyticum DSM 571]|uniref:Methyltransferase type 11 n=1 Tax=Thermoanaerobacterium thermosaccharolyticum (strain ATCC 7956 / DSM 571 / NCIMB 9385 / NCA 3814 / NCTC 13789 / WDCM 00135 / 2032) TaxID=580327 RepID=D9TRY6_THETC|nr:class I SAM-dependent methyltransferase [Thermoanaerobacterium thermosaccharolyticum]ADL69665.1 Methyltransferase type 11 [Thermoanaerobacterium thermosaccharolyticum DSM 571]